MGSIPWGWAIIFFLLGTFFGGKVLGTIGLGKSGG